MTELRPCRATAAASALEGLAARLDSPAPSNKEAVEIARERLSVAADLCWVPVPHPLRAVDRGGALVDEVLAFAESVKGKATADEMRAFAARLRAGIPEMERTGWYPLMSKPLEAWKP